MLVAAESVSLGAPEPAEEPPSPRDAVPIQAVPMSSSATVAVTLGEDVPSDRLLAAIEAVKSALALRPGPSPVVLYLSVAGALRQVRLPDRVAWDDNLADAVRRAAAVPVDVSLQSVVEERIA